MRANFSGTQLFRADFRKADATEVMFTQASMIAATLYCDLSGALLAGADMRGVSFLGECRLDGADFSGVYLQEHEREVITAHTIKGAERIDWYGAISIPAWDPRPYNPIPEVYLPTDYWDRRPPNFRRPEARVRH